MLALSCGSARSKRKRRTACHGCCRWAENNQVPLRHFSCGSNIPPLESERQFTGANFRVTRAYHQVQAEV